MRYVGIVIFGGRRRPDTVKLIPLSLMNENMHRYLNEHNYVSVQAWKDVQQRMIPADPYISPRHITHWYQTSKVE